MPFDNPIVGGTALTRTAINSPNFVSGSTGWSINRDGSAEFSNATVRGQVIVGSLPNAIELFHPPNIPTELVNFYAARSESLSAVQIFRDATGRYEYFGNLSGGGLVIGAVDNFGDVQEMIFTWHQVPHASFAFGEASPVDLYVSNQGGATTFLSDVPLAFSVNAVAETWHGLAYQNAWSNFGGTGVTGQYRLVASPPNSLQLVGIINAGTKADGTVVANLPVGYRPAHDSPVPLAINPATLGGITTPQFQLQQNGNLVCFGCTAATTVYLNAIIALDA